MANTEHRVHPVILLGVIVLVTFVLGLLVGAAPLRLVPALQNPEGTDGLILLHLRLPRVLTTLLCGAAFGTAGALLQCVLHNPLASPNVLGVNAGAGFGATLLMALSPHADISTVSAAAFLGAVAACLMVLQISRMTRASRLALVLTGIALTALFGAGSDALTTLFPDTLASANHFRTGGAAQATLQSLIPLGIAVPLCTGISCLLHPQLDLLALGDDVAHSLGLHPQRMRTLALLLACALAALGVAAMGLIGFVGLMAPHLVRLWVGSENRLVLPLSALLGASMLTLCDLAARSLFSPFELPVSILLNFLGAPFFLFVLIHRRSHA